MKLLTIPLIVALSFFASCSGSDTAEQEQVNMDSVRKQDSVMFEIKTLMDSINRPGGEPNRICSLRFGEDDEPDVDVFDPESRLILAHLDAADVRMIMERYGKFCSNCCTGDSTWKAYSQDTDFIEEGNYSIEFNFWVKNYNVSHVTALIYGQNRFILFSIGRNEEQR